MVNHDDRLEKRVVYLERQSRRLTVVLAGTFLMLGSGLLMAFSQARSADEPLRVRGLIVEDAQGRPRILMGSPIADRNVGGNPRTGIVIQDAAGAERFGLGLQESGRVVMGFDAPVGKGDDRNRERITVVADENGGSYVRFLDRMTSVPARLYLDEQNRVWLEFVETQANQIVRRRIGVAGDEVTRTPR
ncbi:MAG TPA: hypothetical protein VJN96_09730 [Vicinamibacterales bacterium]|nr:hypothetical protein [Vicinamibacterales bacterium]